MQRVRALRSSDQPSAARGWFGVIKGGIKLLLQHISNDPKKISTTWINKTTGELVTVVGRECPEGCREPDREKVDKIVSELLYPRCIEHRLVVSKLRSSHSLRASSCLPSLLSFCLCDSVYGGRLSGTSVEPTCDGYPDDRQLFDKCRR
jgi:hypothetical protein